MSTILIVDDDNAICRTLEMHFQSQAHGVQIRHSVEEALEHLSGDNPDVMILDIRMAGMSGLEGLPLFKQQLPDLRIIMITAFHDMSSTIEAMQKGADEYIHKPLDLDEIDQAVANALQYQQQQSDSGIDIPLDTGYGEYNLVGSSSAMREIFKTIGRVADTTASVLITGESGTGKEMVARAIHNASDRRNGAFVAINCAALVDSLLESEMFGHKRGSFTGAVKDQLGKFELASDGTLFLDEVGELSPSIQAKLLRVLQERQFTPVGAGQPQHTNARIIAATNVNLEQAMAKGAFREDLFYRLQIVNMHLPPLRERKSDLVELVQTLMSGINKDLGRRVNTISLEAMGCINTYHWPGNVRELQNLLTKAVALCKGDVLTQDLLPVHLSEGVELAVPAAAEETASLSLQDMERYHVEQVLERTSWHRGKACEILGVSRPRLQRMIANYELTEPGEA
ncbi:sigma-54-dependent transcriptional regulator [Amphritea sp. HPY]|uniref:sigma-54-dependent transcriptional regulator n=1 Tax=Amphritea sp. HPY TaxID=3421652 RepID=UPI003D7D52E1